MESPIEISAPVAEVTLLEDRARVVRRGRVRLPRGVVTVKVEDVAPVISDKTLSASARGAKGAARVNVARVARAVRILPESRPEEVRALDAAIETEQRELAGLLEGRNALEREIDGLGRVGALALKEVAEDTSWGRSAPEAWTLEARALLDRERALGEKILTLGFEIERREEMVADLLDQRAAHESPAARFGADLLAEIEVPEEGEYDLAFDYLVPGACWRPHHVAELARDGKRMAFGCDGCVWQNTGEAWTDARIFFSTQRPSAGAEPPALRSDVLAARPRPDRVVVEAREQEIRTTGLGPAPTKDAAELPGIDDAGEVRTLEAKGRATVPSDGRPHRFEIFRFECAAETERILAAELAPAVILKSVQKNAAPHPILAGPVDLIRDCGFVGRTSVLFIAPGESFPLGWGPDGALRVHREASALDEEKGLISSWISREHRVTVHVSNIGDEGREIIVTERMPVSEVEKVEIVPDPKNTTGQSRPDKDGFVRWKVALKTFGRDSVHLRYTLKKHKDVAGI